MALASGLAHAHDRGILHRDIKPANVIVTEEGEPMFVDFNLSEDIKCRGNGAFSFAGGTAPYSSPEQIDEFLQKPVTIDERSDIFSLGVVLFELLTGRVPFESRGEGGWAAARESRKQTPPSARAKNAAVTPRLDVVVRKCLEENPERRYQCARDLQEDLIACVAGRPLIHAIDPAPEQRFKRWMQRYSRALAILGGLSLVGSSCFAAYTANVLVNRHAAAQAFSTAEPLWNDWIFAKPDKR
jgi:serine/threonine protein kinase